MPKENKKRGRRGEKRKHDHVEDVQHDTLDAANKRRKSLDLDEQDGFVSLETHDETVDAAYPPAFERPFFGMLDEEEQEYFKRADDLLEANAFGDTQERDLFLGNVYREAEGKELKIAQSQSCSRLMERLIRLSSPAQLKTLFQSFSGNFLHLATHRFASHCCEALFLRAGPVVTQELMAPDAAAPTTSANDIFVSMENLFLHTLAEFEGELGYLITEKYASHVLRVLLLVLSGEPFDEGTMKHLLQSKRKETVAVQGSEESNLAALRRSRSVPQAFSDALAKLIAGSIAGLDTDKLRALATHPNGNPTLQLLLKLELTHFGKQRAKDETSIIRQLLPDDPITADSGSAQFIGAIVYDTTGSHLVEQIVQHAPAKMFKSLYKQFFQERVGSFARNEVAAYVVCRILDRLGRDELYDAHEILIPLVPSLLEKSRTLVIRKLIERCVVREIDTQAAAVQIDKTFSGPDGFELERFLQLSSHGGTQGNATNNGLGQFNGSTSNPGESSKVHFNVLAQAMLLVPGSLSSLILGSMTLLDSAALQTMAKDPVVCRTLQAALTTVNASIIQRRKLIQHFYGHIGEMAADKSASHVVDCIWEGTHGLAFIRERIAEELAENEAALRESTHGRAVWRNWKMDIYKRRRTEWVRQSKIKAGNDGFQSFSEIEANKKEGSAPPAKTRLELARERHAKSKLAKSKAQTATTENITSSEGPEKSKTRTAAPREQKNGHTDRSEAKSRRDRLANTETEASPRDSSRSNGTAPSRKHRHRVDVA